MRIKVDHSMMKENTYLETLRIGGKVCSVELGNTTVIDVQPFLRGEVTNGNTPLQFDVNLFAKVRGNRNDSKYE